MRKLLCIPCLMLFFLADAQAPVDANATPETKALLENLSILSKKGFLFGHQEDDAYGVGWTTQEGRSDVKDLVGSYPAVHGWDISRVEQQKKLNIDGVDFENMQRWILATYKRGGINTVSWHVDNPGSKKDAWDKTPAVKDILPGGVNHEYFVKQLDLAADYLARCKDGNIGIPIIFRPWHEHNGDWFWWGKGNCTEQEFIQLWRFTVTYLRDTKKLHHLLYAFSPDRSRIDPKGNFESQYLYGYPGDEYVDILGLDDYADVGFSASAEETEKRTENFVKSMTAVSDLAGQRKKVAAVTETGQESIVNPAWYTQVVSGPIGHAKEVHVAYVMVWRNANTKHHYAPYPGHASVSDFKKFYDDPITIFESDLPDVYHVK